MEFDELLAAARAGSDQAFAALYRRYNHRVLRYFAAFVPTDQEDLAAETWMGAARGLNRFEGDEGRFRTWLFAIAHRRLMQHWRAASRRPADPTDPSSFAGIGALDDVEKLVTADTAAQEAVRKLAAVLSEDQLEIVLLRVLGGLTVDEVAQAVGKRPGTVRVVQHKALRKLAVANFSIEEVTT